MTVSSPGSPQSSSLVEPPSITSLPKPPLMKSQPSPPYNVSSPSSPRIAAIEIVVPARGCSHLAEDDGIADEEIVAIAAGQRISTTAVVPPAYIEEVVGVTHDGVVAFATIEMVVTTEADPPMPQAGSKRAVVPQQVAEIGVAIQPVITVAPSNSVIAALREAARRLRRRSECRRRHPHPRRRYPTEASYRSYRRGLAGLVRQMAE